MDSIGRRQGDPVFDAIPTPTLLLDTDLVIRAVNKAYEKAVSRSADELVTMPVFEAFPDNPDDPDADGVANLSASLERAARGRRPHHMVVQRYDIVDLATGEWLHRVWQPQNSPVLDGDAKVVGLVHQAQDITPSGEDLRRVLVAYRTLLLDSPSADARSHSRALVERVDAVAAIAQQHQDLVEEVGHLRRALSSRASIDQAKGMIMAERGCGPDEAFKVLKRLSSSTNVRVADVALAFVYQAQAGGLDKSLDRIPLT